MNILKYSAKGFSFGLFLIASLVFAIPAFALVNVNPRLDNRYNPMPIARVANTAINSIAEAPNFYTARRPAVVGNSTPMSAWGH